MSSNIRVLKICEMCSKDFIAKKTTSKTCSDGCAKRFYKLKIKNSKIAQVELETAFKKTTKGFITEEQIKVLNDKQYLTLKEAALLLNISALTLRRWTLGGKMQASKMGKKWVYEKHTLSKGFRMNTISQF